MTAFIHKQIHIPLQKKTSSGHVGMSEDLKTSHDHMIICFFVNPLTKTMKNGSIPSNYAVWLLGIPIMSGQHPQ